MNIISYPPGEETENQQFSEQLEKTLSQTNLRRKPAKIGLRERLVC